MTGKQSAVRPLTQRRCGRGGVESQSRTNQPASTFDPRFPTPRLGGGWPAPGPHQLAPWFNPLDSRHILVNRMNRRKAPSDAAPAMLARVTFDGGVSWRESSPLPMLPNWACAEGPVLAMDARGTLHLATRAQGRGRAQDCLAMFRSEDGGLHWSQPVVALQGRGECSYTLVADLNPASAFLGHAYLVAAAGGELHVVRSQDSASWTPVSQPGPSFAFPGPCRYPAALVDSAGALHVVWSSGARNQTILSSYSGDGGLSFAQPEMVAGLTDMAAYPETMPATCITPEGVFLCAWTGYRAGHARICCRRSTDRARTWLGPSTGQPLAPDGAPHRLQFRPRLLVTPAGEICCAYYEYDPHAMGGVPLVELVMSVSYDRGATFSRRMVLSAVPWSPVEAETAAVAVQCAVA